MPHSMSTGAQSSSITRRRLAAGAAWATPTLVVGAAAPATAASPCPAVAYTLDWDVDTSHPKQRGNARHTHLERPTRGRHARHPDSGVLLRGQHAGGTTPRQPQRDHRKRHGRRTVRRRTLAPSVLDWIAGPVPANRSRRVHVLVLVEPRPHVRHRPDVHDYRPGHRQRQLHRRRRALRGIHRHISSSPGVGGSATQASPARQEQAGAPLPNSSADGNLTVSYAGPITSFTLTYWNAVETFDLLVDRAQAIYITDMTCKSRSAC